MSSWLPGFEPPCADVDDDDRWFTPPAVLSALDEVLPGWGDPCCDPVSPAHERAAWRFDVRQGDDGLTMPWRGDAYCNPPYSDASTWIGRCAEQHSAGRQVVGLFTARVEGIAWHDHVWRPGVHVVLPRGRLRFVGVDGKTSGNAMTGTAFVCWGVCGHTFAFALRRNGVACAVVELSEVLPW